MEGPSKPKKGKTAPSSGKSTAAWARKTEAVDLFGPETMDLLQVALRAMVAAGRVILIGTARGGRGLILKTWVDGEPVSEYAREEEEVQEVLDKWRCNWLEEAGTTNEHP